MRISDWSSDVCSSDLEALEWSGMTVREYAAALAISRHSLARWRDLLAEREVPVDWRARLHPRDRPPINRAASPRTHGELRRRKSVGEGKSVSVCVDLGGRRLLQKKKRPIVHNE